MSSPSDFSSLPPEKQLAAASAVFADEALALEPDEVRARHAAGAIQLVDVREPHEWQAGRVPGARHIEIERLAWNAPSLDPALPVCFYCRLGVRAAMAAHAFRRVGYEAYTMSGGFSAWVAASLPVDPEDGTVADH